MDKSLIIKNLTAAEQYVNDLGIYVPCSEQVNVTNLFSDNKIAPLVSSDLLEFINNDILKLNDGNIDIAKEDVTFFLQRFAVTKHAIDKDHIGTLPQDQISLDDGMFTRSNATETINQFWTFPSGMSIESGLVLPTTNLTNGRLFLKTDEPALYTISNGEWHNVGSNSSSNFYGGSAIYEFASKYHLFQTGRYLNTAAAASSIAPAIMCRAGAIRSLTATSSREEATTYQILEWHSTTNTWEYATEINIAEGDTTAIASDISYAFDAGTRFACYVSAGRASYPHVYMEVVWSTQE